MRNWIGYSSFLILFLSLGFSFTGYAQSTATSLTFNHPDYTLLADRHLASPPDTTINNYPDPNSVMYKSVIIPGWGQIVNKQAWKVPIVYGLLAGLGYYSVHLTKKYHDYRAAYYNLNPDISSDDLRFGPTPSYISEDANLQQLRTLRNTYRNRRDLVYVGIVVAYGLNIIDAYVFAHMRTFDVSEDLSMRTHLQPALLADATPGMTISIDLISK